jgi:hypothetical protein
MPGFPDIVQGDITGPVSQYGPTWAASLGQTSRSLFLLLFLIQITILGVQAVFFKGSILEYIRDFASKVIIGCAVMAALANAPLIFPWLVSTIAGIGGTVALNIPSPSPAACAAKLVWQCMPAAPPAALDPESTLLTWGMIYFGAGDLSRIADSIFAAAISWTIGTPFPPEPGAGADTYGILIVMAHEQFQIACFALGMICVTSAALIYLTYVLLVFETQFVMAIGCFTLAGYGFKFTETYAKAFPKYCFTVGTKFFAFYFIVAIVAQLLQTASSSFMGSSGGIFLSTQAAAAIPFGAGALLVLMATSPAPIIAMICSILIAAVPQFAASLTSGGSALSAMGGLGSITGQFQKR